MSQEYTVKSFTNKNKPDKFGNHTYTAVFEEDPRPVYIASKSELQAGFKKYGDILEGEYGPRFKSAQKPDDYQPSNPRTEAPTHVSQSMPQLPQRESKAPQERSDDIRWGLCIKEANAYVTKNRPDLNTTEWAVEVYEYANSLFFMTAEPREESTNKEDIDVEAVKDFFGSDEVPRL